MGKDPLTQQTYNQLDQETYLLSWLEAFFVDRKAQNLTPGSIRFYREKLKLFTDYCEAQALTRIDQITPAFIRQFLLYLETTGHNPGGVHTAYRSLKAFLRWYELEAEPTAWHNPIRKVKQPKLPDEPLEPVPLLDVDRMVKTCDTGSFYDLRDKALLLFLVDTGLRANECLSLDLADVDQVRGEILVKQGKGRKPRVVPFERRARKAYRAYLKTRTDRNTAAWINKECERLKYDGLRAMLTRRARSAGVPTPTPHDFRRAFAITMLRNGCDLITLARIMGHTTIRILQRYLYLLSDDLKVAHSKGSPAESMKGGDR